MNEVIEIERLKATKATLSKTVASYARLFASNPDNEKIGNLLADATMKYEIATSELKQRALLKYETAVLQCGTVLTPEEQAVLEALTDSTEFRNVDSSVNVNRFICSCYLGMTLVQETLPSLVKKRMLYGFATRPNSTLDLTERGQKFVTERILDKR